MVPADKYNKIVMLSLADHGHGRQSQRWPAIYAMHKLVVTTGALSVPILPNLMERLSDTAGRNPTVLRGMLYYAAHICKYH